MWSKHSVICFLIYALPFLYFYVLASEDKADPKFKSAIKKMMGGLFAFAWLITSLSDAISGFIIFLIICAIVIGGVLILGFLIDIFSRSRRSDNDL